MEGWAYTFHTRLPSLPWAATTQTHSLTHSASWSATHAIRRTRSERYSLPLAEKRRLVAVMFTERDNTIRITSARTATRRERLDYEEGQD